MRRTIFRSPKCWRAGFKKKPQNPQNHRVVIKVVTKSPCFFDFCYSSQSSRQLFGVWSQLYFGIWTRNKVANEGKNKESSTITRLVMVILVGDKKLGGMIWLMEGSETTVNCVFFWQLFHHFCDVVRLHMGISKNSGTPKMDGENNGKRY